MLSVQVEPAPPYIGARHYCALGALAFWEVPKLDGEQTKLRLVAVPPEWMAATEKIVNLLGAAGMRARFEARTLEIERSDVSPTSLLRRAGLALFSLDSFTRSRTQKTQLQTLRAAAFKAFRETGSELLEFIDDAIGDRALRVFLSSTPWETRRQAEDRPVQSDERAPEILTSLGRTIRLDENQWAATYKAFARSTVDPRWLIYVPPGMCSAQGTSVDGPLEHPSQAFDYYRNEGINEVVAEYKHMGSRAIAVVCRDEMAGIRRFEHKALGSIYTRNGRPFFEDDREPLDAIRQALTKAQFWDKFKTDWVCLDGEFLPWTLKAASLLEGSHRELEASGLALLSALRMAGVELPSSSSIEQRLSCFRSYGEILNRYSSMRDEPASFAPFQLIATEGRSYFRRTHRWLMETLGSIVRRSDSPSFTATRFISFCVDDNEAVRRCAAWWNELGSSGAEGLVVKPLYCVPRGRRGFAQPGIKCRTPEHLRMVYGPEYDLLENRWRLASRDALERRREKHRRVIKQLALSVEGVERFIAGKPVSSIENCVRGVLSLDY